MIKQKNIFLFFTLIFILAHIASGKGHFKRKLNIQPNFKFNNKTLEREFNFQDYHTSTIMTQTDYFLDTFDSDLDEWTIDDSWNRTDINFHSPDYSINSFENNQESSQIWKITSPTYTLPEQLLNETIHYSFWLRNDMLLDGIDDDGTIDQFFSLSLLVPNEDIWNITNLNSYDGRSYWCGDEELNGYGDTWVQYLDTPEILLQENSRLTATMQWAIEDTDGVDIANIVATCEDEEITIIDGWDQVNVQISDDGGSTWDVLIGNEPYDFQCGYGTVYNGFAGLPGWSGIQNWHEVDFDLSNYANRNVIIRFAFYSDPSWSTIDDEVLTGLQIDDIQISSNVILFEDNADNPQMVWSGENWIEQLYDYWDDGSLFGEGEAQPGSIFWEEYTPGTAFEGNILQNLTEYSGQNVKFRFQTFFDGDADGGIGLFIDDFRIYSELTEFYPPPSNLIVENSDGNVLLTWSNYLNNEGEYEHILDSGDNAFFGEYDLDCPDLVDCSTFMGNAFIIPGNSTVDSVSIYNLNQNDTEVTIAGFNTVGQSFNYIPTFEEVVTLSSQGWNTFAVNNWDFINPYIIGQTVTDEISVAGDINSPPYGLFLQTNNSWEFTYDPPTPFLGIRAHINKESLNVTYNIHRRGSNESDYIIIDDGITDSTYIDTNTLGNELYYYAISATYPDGGVSEPSLSESITVLPASYQELSWDDGYFESWIELEADDSLAVKYTASTMGQQIVRFKWYQVDDGGHAKLVLWGNSENGIPGEVLYSKLLTTNYTPITGWNGYDLSEENWSVSGDFWIGLKAYSNTSKIARDYDVESNSSMYKPSNSNWSTIDNWNLGIRVFLDCASENIDECGLCDGDNSTCLDCAGVPNGLSVEDCAGLCNGEAVTDCTGICNGEAVTDCAGICNGSTMSDECGICGGSGPTADCGCNNIPTDACDCEGHTFDECDVCDGDNSSCTDCLDVPNGDAVIDECGVCSNSETYNSTCTGCMNQNYAEYDENSTIPCEDCCSSTTLTNNENIIPSKFEIINLYPNPFNPQINIEYNLPTTSNVKVSIYNVKGQKVDKLVDSIQHTGFHSLTWVATEQNSGIYFIQITADTDIINRKIMYLK